MHSQLPVRRIQRSEHGSSDPGSWPGSLPIVQQVLRDGLELGATTVRLGEDGSGTSTLVEALAIAFGLSNEGGSARQRGRLALGFFVRAETMHGFYTYLEDNPPAG